MSEKSEYKKLAYTLDSTHFDEWKRMAVYDSPLFKHRVALFVESERIAILKQIVHLDALEVYKCIAESGRCDILEKILAVYAPSALHIMEIAVHAASHGQLGVIMRLRDISEFSVLAKAKMYSNAIINGKDGVISALNGWYPTLKNNYPIILLGLD